MNASSKGTKLLKSGFKSLKGMFQSNEKAQVEEMRQNQNLIFNELSKFVQYFINFGLSHKQAHDILIFYCDYFQLEQSRIHLLLTEL